MWWSIFPLSWWRINIEKIGRRRALWFPRIIMSGFLRQISKAFLFEEEVSNVWVDYKIWKGSSGRTGMIVKYKKEWQSSLSYFPSMIKRRPCQILFLPLVKRECHLENTNYYLPFLASKTWLLDWRKVIPFAETSDPRKKVLDHSINIIIITSGIIIIVIASYRSLAKVTKRIGTDNTHAELRNQPAHVIFSLLNYRGTNSLQSNQQFIGTPHLT